MNTTTTATSEVLTASSPDFEVWATQGYIVLHATQLIPGPLASTWATASAKVSIKDLLARFSAPKV